MDSGEDLGSLGSFRLICPSKTRSRGSVGELVEFCAESIEGSKQCVRQELAQDPCGHDLLPAPTLTVTLTSRKHSSEGDKPTPKGTTTRLTSPPCSSPEMLDVHAPVGSGSSDSALSSRAGSQPGSASGLGATSPLSPPSGDAEVHGAMDIAAALGMLSSLQGRRCSGSGEQHFDQPAASSPAQQQHLHTVHMVGDGFGGGRLAGGQAQPPHPELTPPRAPQQLQLLPPGQLGGSAARRRSLLGALEVPDREVVVGRSHTAVDETDFVHVCLTPIRTRTQTQEHSEASPPISYPDSLTIPALQSDTLSCGLKAEAQQGGRPTIHLVASSTSTLGPPGAFNPYDRTAMVGSYGYGGGHSYGFNYGGAPTGAPTTSSTGCYWANQQQRQLRCGAAAVQHAAATAELPAAAAERSFLVAAPSPASGRSLPWSAPRCAAAQLAYSSQRGEEEVEHIIMIPGMPRHRKSTAAAAAQPPASEPAAPAAVPVKAAEAAQPPTVGRGCCSSTVSAAGQAAVEANKRVHGSTAAAEVLPAETPAGRTVGPLPVTSEGNNLLKQVLKVALMAAAAMLAVVHSQG